jgi:hypothetical protein
MPPSTVCYVPETSVTTQVNLTTLRDPATCENQFKDKTYYRLRQQVKITEAKIREGEGVHPTGDCGDTYYGGLRWVGYTTGGDKAFWESQNHKKEDLKDFILVETDQKEGYYYFDVYIDETVDIPDFVKNCQETGGLIPVVEGFVLPPQSFGLGELGADCSAFPCLSDPEPAFDTLKTGGELKPYYTKVAEVETCPMENPPAQGEPVCPGDRAFIIGKLTATGTEETKTYSVYYHADTMYLWEEGTSGGGSVAVYSPTEGVPPKPTGRHPTLQLKALKFITTSEWTWATPECKPVIYLYPEEKIQLSIKLNPDGYLTKTEPLYNGGWENIVAYPDGELIYQGKSFASLHYEAMINKFKTPQEGWVVKKEALPEFFKEILPRLGLNPQEAEDFQEYWLGRLTGSPYFFAGLLSEEEIERIDPVVFSVEPETFIRVRFYFKDLEELFGVERPVLPLPPTRSGFSVVEWGGLYNGRE